MLISIIHFYLSYKLKTQYIFLYKKTYENDYKVVIVEDCWIGTDVTISFNTHNEKHIVVGVDYFIKKTLLVIYVMRKSTSKAVKSIILR